MLRESRSRQNIPKVSGGILQKRRIPLTARNTSSLVIDSLCDRAEEENTAVVGLYCDFLAQQEQTITSIMGAILKQLVGRGGIPEGLREAFQKGKKEFGGNVKDGEVTQDREVTHNATVVKKSDNSTNSQPNWTKQDDIN